MVWIKVVRYSVPVKCPVILSAQFPMPLLPIRLLLLLCLLLPRVLSATGVDAQMRAWAEQQPPVQIGIMLSNEPYSMMEEGIIKGFSIDVLEEVSKNTGLNFDYKPGNWAGIYQAFEDGKLDAIDKISWSEACEDFTLFTKPYHYRRLVVMHDSKRPIGEIRNLEGLQSYRIGILRNIYYKGLFRSRGLEFNEYDGLDNLVRALAFGWVDAIIGPEVNLNYLAHKAGYNSLKVVGRSHLEELELEDLRLGIRKGKPELHQVMEAGLAAISPERMAQLLGAWQDFGGQRVEVDRGFHFDRHQAFYIYELGALRVGFAPDYPPFSLVEGGRVRGLARDYLSRLQGMIGFRIEPVIEQWSLLREKFMRGEIDIMTNFSYLPEREAFASFTEPYYIEPNVAFSRNKNFRMRNHLDLEGLRIAIPWGISYEAELRQYFGDKVVGYGNQRALFNALADGDVDVALAPLTNGNYWITELGLFDIYKAGELQLPNFKGEDMRFAVRKGLEPLARLFDQAMRYISPMERRSIESRWLGAREAVKGGTRQTKLSERERTWLLDKKELIACVDPDWMPLEGLDHNGQHEGIAADYLALMARHLPVAIRILPTKNWQESVEAAKARRCDLYSMAMSTPERRSYMDFTKPYYITPNVLLGRIETPFVNDLNEFAGKRVGLVSGYAFAELFRLGYPQVKFVDVANERKGLKLLQQREIDGYIGTLATINYYLKELGLADLKVIGRAPGDWALSLATRNDEPQLLSIAQKLVDDLSDEDHASIRNRWQSVELKTTVDMRRLWQWIGGTLVALVLLVFWIRKLRSLNGQLAEANLKLAQLSLTDSLTGLGNRKFFDQEYPRYFRLCQRQNLGFAVAMIDIDHFKRVNDRFGHPIGDECLRMLAACMQAQMRRETDYIARFGGEEFVVFMSMSDQDELLARFESLRQAVEALRTTADAEVVNFSISIGLACGTPDHEATPEDWLKRADDALYRAKGNGRNRIELG